MGTFKILVNGQRLFLVVALGKAYVVVICQRVCGGEVIRMFYVFQEVVSQRRICASRVSQCFLPSRPIKILEKEECLNNDHQLSFWCVKIRQPYFPAD